MIGFIDTFYTYTTRDFRQYGAIALPHTLQFTVTHTYTHTLGFSVFTSRILATDLSHSHCNFKSHMKYSLHRRIPFIVLILRLPNPETRLPSIPSSYPGRLKSRNSTLHSRLFYSRSRLLTVPFYNPSARTTQKQPLLFVT
jgi:hypothetical protein